MSPEELKELIERAGITQAEAADKIGVHRITINRWLNGRESISAKNAFYVHHFLGFLKKRKQSACSST